MNIHPKTTSLWREARIFANVMWTAIILGVIYLIEYFTGYGIYALAVYTVYGINSLQNLQTINAVEIENFISSFEQRMSRIENKLELDEFEYVSPSDRLSKLDDRLNGVDMRLTNIEERGY